MTSRVNEGLPREGGRCKAGAFNEEREGFFLVQKSDRRETTSVLEDARFMSDWNVYDLSLIHI